MFLNVIPTYTSVTYLEFKYCRDVFRGASCYPDALKRSGTQNNTSPCVPGVRFLKNLRCNPRRNSMLT